MYILNYIDRYVNSSSLDVCHLGEWVNGDILRDKHLET